MDVFSELKRRNVVRTATAYAVIAWLLLQIASIVMPTFGAPAWVMQGVTILLIAGFPLAVGLSWFFNITPGGIVRDENDPGISTAVPRSTRLIDAIIIGVLLIAVALFAYDEFVIEEQERSEPGIRPAIAVLPFDNVDESDDARIFADGLATELITRLSSWPSLIVIARSASFADGLSDDLFAAGQKLDARYFVSGDMRRVEDRIRLNVSVVDSTDSSIVWNESFDRDVGDIFAVEDEISTAIVGQISPALLARESERAMRADADNLNAWEAAHRGWWYMNTETEQGYVDASEWLDVAIDLDPSWGWPYAAKALTIYRSFLNGWTRRSDEAKSEMMENAQRAVQLDADDAFAHHALGHAYGVVNRRDESILAMARGVQLNPNDAMAQACYGMQLAAAARSEEAIQAVEIALSLSPDDPWMYWYTLVLARAHFAAGDYATSEEWAVRSLQIKPAFAAFLHATSSAAHQGKVDLARQRVIDRRASGGLPPVAVLEDIFLASTELDYATRLMQGLRMADFDTAGVDDSDSASGANP